MKPILPLLFGVWLLGAGMGVYAQTQHLDIPFAYNSAEMDGAQRQKIRESLPTGSVQFQLEGRASSAGSEVYNLALSQRRVEAVARILHEAGIPESAITRTFTGEAKANPQTDLPADRRVVLSFTLSAPPPQPQKPQTEATAPTQSVHLQVVDAVTRKPLTGSFLTQEKPQAFTAVGVDFRIPQTGTLTVHLSAEGYRDTNVLLLPRPTSVTVEMLPLNVLEKLVFANIYFYPNLPEIVPESYRALDQVYLQLAERKNVNIQIRGHVNWPLPNIATPDEEKGLMDLSQKRAEAVMKWLIKKGIPAQNLSAVGLGHTQMLFPRAVTEGEQAQNRRVEILLLEK